MHRPSALLGAALQTVFLLVGTAAGIPACFLLAPLGPVVAGWHAAPHFAGVIEGGGAAAVGVIASFVGFLGLLWVGVTGPLDARIDVVFITGTYGTALLLFALPFAAIGGALLGRVGFVLEGFAPDG